MTPESTEGMTSNIPALCFGQEEGYTLRRVSQCQSGAISADLLGRDPLSHCTHDPECYTFSKSLRENQGHLPLATLQWVRRLLGVAPRTLTPDLGEDQVL